MIREFEATDFLSALAWEAQHRGDNKYILRYEDMRQKLSHISQAHPEIRVNMGLVELTSFERLESKNIKIELFTIEIDNLQSSEMRMIINRNKPSDDICRIFNA